MSHVTLRVTKISKQIFTVNINGFEMSNCVRGLAEINLIKIINQTAFFYFSVPYGTYITYATNLLARSIPYNGKFVWKKTFAVFTLLLAIHEYFLADLLVFT